MSRHSAPSHRGRWEDDTLVVDTLGFNDRTWLEGAAILTAKPCTSRKNIDVVTWDVIADVMGQGLRLAAAGVVAGIGLALAGTRLLNSVLFGTSPTDALTFAAVAALLVTIAAGASLIPALRASRVDPLIALRDE